MEQKPARHHYLITGEIVFKARDMETVNGMRANGILLTENTNIGVAAIGKAQQVIQMNFFQKMNDPTLIVIDVIILGMTYLGHMTEEEFKRVPPGMVQKEMEKPAETQQEIPANEETLADPLMPGQADALDTAIKEIDDEH